MASEPKPPATPVPERFKYRLRFRKGDDLRLVSHHDLMHCCERLFRRADIPVAATQGFHPTPRMVFALSLSLGVLGSNEVLELELTRELPEDELLQLLRRNAPPGLVFHNARRIPLKSTAQVRRAFYRLPLPIGGPLPRTDLADDVELSKRCDLLLARQHLWMERTKPYRRQVDIRPFIESVRVGTDETSPSPSFVTAEAVATTPNGAELSGSQTPQEGRFPSQTIASDSLHRAPNGESLEFTLWMTPFGTGKPDEILRLLELEHLADEGAILERYDLELIDEVGPDAPPLPIVDPKAIISTTLEILAVPARAASEEEKPSSRPTSLIEGPLSFET